MPTFYEFFAGGGMARAGLGDKWQCLFANDFDRKKVTSYQANWGAKEIVCDDIRNIAPAELPGLADLIWGSFPCQDLSLAGGGAGLKGERSGTFWPFMNLISDLRMEGRPPKIVVLENVVGTLTSHRGADFSAICRALRERGYAYGAVVIDAALFVPQSRPRLFVIAVREDVSRQAGTGERRPLWHSKALNRAYENLPLELKQSWIWWNPPTPPQRNTRFVDLVEDHPNSVDWHTTEETRALLSMMSDVNLAKVQTAMAAEVRMVGGVYKRTRFQQGVKVQRAEVRFDDIAGCLRTPAGGSSRQLILVVEGKKIRSRLVSTRETARLMGLPESYRLPLGRNEAYHLTGDGVVVHVVKFISEHILLPVLADCGKADEISSELRSSAT